MTRQILVTNALPYANGSIHLGHLVGYIGADIWVRAMRAMGHDVIYVCADDAHGTAIMLKAQSQNINPQALINEVKQEHEADFQGFFVGFDHYDSTHSPANQSRACDIYQKNKASGNISTRPVTQLYDPQKGLFLADRFVKGTCPKCHAPDQYGDSCEQCGTTYHATELIDPYSTLSGATPILKESEHYFFNLPNFEAFLKEWTRQDGRLQASVANKLDEWFEAGLSDWDISRDAPYFGFKIPDTDDKYFYVWVDAPIGYMSSFENYITAHRPDLSFDDFWQKNSKKEIYHFIGKDIVYFHALFWPAMLTGANYRTPTSLFVNGFLTVNSEKMSKSRGTFIKASTYLKHLNPEYLRYYFASKLSTKVEDSDLNLDDFIAKVNSDLVGKFVNIASRCAKFINSNFDNQLSNTFIAPQLLQIFDQKSDEIIKLYEHKEFASAVREIMALADIANQYIDEHKPWAIAKINPNDPAVQEICTVGLNLFLKLAILLAPILPNTAKKVQALFGLQSFDFELLKTTLTNQSIALFEPLMTRIDKKTVDKMIDDSKESLTQNTISTQDQAVIDTTDMIGIDDFAKVKMQVAKVLACSKVEGADKLLQFTLDIGETHSDGTPKTRNVFSGIAKFYRPEELQGKTVICVTNLAPRKMKFGVSEGMILSAEQDGVVTVVILPDTMTAGATLA